MSLKEDFKIGGLEPWMHTGMAQFMSLASAPAWRPELQPTFCIAFMTVSTAVSVSQ